MKDLSEQWTRRQFSQVLAATAAAALLLTRKASEPDFARRDGFAFIGSSAAESTGGTVRVYRVSGEHWREMHAISAASPAHLVMHPTVPVLYVVHDVAEWDRRPRGAVSAYRFDKTTGRLTHAGSQPLSLSATRPQHAVITADSQALFVAAESGGIYNALPIAVDGTLQPVSAIRKEFGLQDGNVAKVATPRQLDLHADGSIYAADPGQETVSRFAVSRHQILLQHRSRVHAGAGASQLAFSNSGDVYALNAKDGSVSRNTETAEGLSPASLVFEPTGPASMQMHPDADLLALSADGCLQVLRVSPRGGHLALRDSVRQPRLLQMQFSANGTQLFGLQAKSGEVLVYSLDPCTGRLSLPRNVAHANGARSMLLHSA